MKKINILAGITLLACGLYSCNNESEFGNFAMTSSNEIHVKVSNTAELTRGVAIQTAVSTTTIPTDGYDIQVTEYDSYNFTNTEKKGTRASIITTDGTNGINQYGNSFLMDAWTEAIIVDRSTGREYDNHPFNETEWSYAGSSWSCNPQSDDQKYWSINKYYIWSWVGDAKLSEPEGTDYHNRTFTFTQDGNTDLLIAYNEETRDENNGNDINVNFEHAMAAIQFQAKNLTPGYKITNIKVNGVMSKIEFDVEGKGIGGFDFDGTPTITNATSYTEIADAYAGESAEESDNNILFVVPQTLDENVSIEWDIVSQRPSGNRLPTIHRKAKFNSELGDAKHKWKAGHRYVYELGVDFIETVTYEFTGNDWSSIRTLNGVTTTGNYWEPFDGPDTSGRYKGFNVERDGLWNFFTGKYNDVFYRTNSGKGNFSEDSDHLGISTSGGVDRAIQAKLNDGYFSGDDLYITSINMTFSSNSTDFLGWFNMSKFRFIAKFGENTYSTTSRAKEDNMFTVVPETSATDDNLDGYAMRISEPTLIFQAQSVTQTINLFVESITFEIIDFSKLSSNNEKVNL